MTFYTDAQRKLQDAFDSRRLADTLEAAIIQDRLDERHSGFIASRDFFFLSTVTADGHPTVSYKGGGVGLVTVVDDKTLAFPAYDGNGMFLSMGNIDETAKIGLLFIDFETPNRVRVQATATVNPDDELMAQYPGALLIVRATVDQVFVNCARYIHKHTRVEQSPYVPDADGNQPVATWKRIDVMQDALSPEDQARAAEGDGLITQEEYGRALQAGET
jgi:predicted pyridoxine 5'-phosphate oxidase superfamily flavin-nucleotide-binding protein